MKRAVEYHGAFAAVVLGRALQQYVKALMHGTQDQFYDEVGKMLRGAR